MKCFRLLVIVVLFIFNSQNVKAQSKTERQIIIQKQGLKYIPDSIFTIENLTSLDLGVGWIVLDDNESFKKITNKNQIEIVSDSIRLLVKLRFLNLGFNNLRTLPNGLFTLENLESLILCYNSDLLVTTMLDDIAKLKNLKFLNIIGTKNVALHRNEILSKLRHVNKILIEWEDIKN